MSTPAGPYPGNPSLPVEVRQKILSTFRHVLTLFSSGNVDDCLIGCEFILKMDSRFTPARRLQEKARNRYSDADISDLLAMADSAAPAGPAPAAAPPRPDLPEPQPRIAEAAQKYEGHDLDPESFTPHTPHDLPPPASAEAESAGAATPEFDSFSLDAPSPALDLFLPPTLPPNLPQTAEEDARAAEREIATLLKQGDETAKKGDREQAIEIWSRVFLIEINNGEAVTRIEKARQEMAEEGRLVADCLKRGRESFEAGEREVARSFFLQAQSLDPKEPTARFYLERMREGAAETATPATGPPAAAEATVSPKKDNGSWLAIASSKPSLLAGRLSLAINPRLLAAVGAFAALTLVGVYLVLKGSHAQEPPPKAAPAGSLQRAQDLGEGGAPEAVVKGSTPAPAGSAGFQIHNDPVRLRAAAEKALAEKRYIEALKNFNLAAPAFRDDPNFAQEQGTASDKVTALTPAVKLYNQGEYETAIPILWRIVQEDRENQDARSYLLRSYYNEGIAQLQDGLYQKAIQAFQEASALDPSDTEALRHKKFAERYQKADLDLMGRIYVRHLSRRP